MAKDMSRKTLVSTTVVESAEQGLTGTEEKVIRMRRGLAAPDDLELPRMGRGNPGLEAQLREIELRALEKSGRLAELRQEARDLAESVDGSPKAKIIARLKDGQDPS